VPSLHVHPECRAGLVPRMAGSQAACRSTGASADEGSRDAAKSANAGELNESSREPPPNSPHPAIADTTVLNSATTIKQEGPPSVPLTSGNKVQPGKQSWPAHPGKGGGGGFEGRQNCP
jgi:hypothetical protein